MFAENAPDVSAKCGTIPFVPGDCTRPVPTVVSLTETTTVKGENTVLHFVATGLLGWHANRAVHQEIATPTFSHTYLFSHTPLPPLAQGESPCPHIPSLSHFTALHAASQAWKSQ